MKTASPAKKFAGIAKFARLALVLDRDEAAPSPPPSPLPVAQFNNEAAPIVAVR